MPEDQNEPRPTDSPDVRTIRQLVRLMQQFDLTAIDLSNEQTKIRLRRRGGELPPMTAAAPIAQAAAAPALPAAAPQPSQPAAETAAPAPKGIVIESPMVGTFYSSPAPDAPAFIQVGSQVRPDSTVCIIEAMKVFTDIPAGVTGTITEVLVKSGQPVEFGQALFRVDPA